VTSTSTSETSDLRDEREAQAIAVETYIYLYPLVMMDATRRQMTNVEAGQQVEEVPGEVMARKAAASCAASQNGARPFNRSDQAEAF